MKECRGEEDNGSLGGPLLRSYRSLANREKLGIYALKYLARPRKERISSLGFGNGQVREEPFSV